MPEITGFHVLLLIAATIVGIYVIRVRNRFKVLEHNIRAAGARIGATIQYARSIDRHTHGQSQQAQQHASQMANKGVRRGPRGRWRPAFFADFNPWPDARGVEVILPAMQAGLGGRDQEYHSRLGIIEAIRVFNQELDQIPAGTVAQHFWQFRHYSYRFAQGSGGSNGKRSGGRGRGSQPNPNQFHRRRNRRRRGRP